VTCLSAGQALALCAAPTDVVLPSVRDTSELEAQQEWLAGEIELWLNDEWTKLDVHRALGEATAQVCPPALVVCKAFTAPASQCLSASAGVWQDAVAGVR